MRLRSIWSEAGANLLSGASKAGSIALALLVIGVGTAWWEHATVLRTLESAEVFQSARAATTVLVAPDRVSGSACSAIDRYDDVRAAGALQARSEPWQLDALPSAPVNGFEVTPEFIALFQSTDAPRLTVGEIVISSDVAEALGAQAGESISINGELAFVTAVFQYPADGRDPRLGYSVLSAASEDGAFSECWMAAWPPIDDYRGRLLSALQPGTSPLDAVSSVQQLNTRLGADYTAPEDFASRPSQVAWMVGFSLSVLVGAMWSQRRRLETGASLHLGASRRDLVAISVIESLACSFPATVGTIAFVVAVSITQDPALAALAAAPALTLLPGAAIGSALGVLLVRRSTYFSDFKKR